MVSGPSADPGELRPASLRIIANCALVDVTLQDDGQLVFAHGRIRGYTEADPSSQAAPQRIRQ